MNVVVIEVKAGKCYLAKALTSEQRNLAQALAHGLHCWDRRPVRQVQRVMAESYGIRRSVGAIARDLALFTCEWCREGSGAEA